MGNGEEEMMGFGPTVTAWRGERTSTSRLAHTACRQLSAKGAVESEEVLRTCKGGTMPGWRLVRKTSASDKNNAWRQTGCSQQYELNAT